jgi:hypothetical protein
MICILLSRKGEEKNRIKFCIAGTKPVIDQVFIRSVFESNGIGSAVYTDIRFLKNGCYNFRRFL